ncbi:hypothetical protein IE53DRAFT_367001 [Violaceomyces palustris]|uniref:Uncharacterized protein n=1 Tax=Violaceomyces palustris TaxID=1673888 RepID=A0ACD0P3E7_9BASI|nr:hypothetical protein IE53DRAFT_367001 [Violaceomyces palustris]
MSDIDDPTASANTYGGTGSHVGQTGNSSDKSGSQEVVDVDSGRDDEDDNTATYTIGFTPNPTPSSSMPTVTSTSKSTPTATSPSLHVLRIPDSSTCSPLEIDWNWTAFPESASTYNVSVSIQSAGLQLTRRQESLRQVHHVRAKGSAVRARRRAVADHMSKRNSILQTLVINAGRDNISLTTISPTAGVPLSPGKWVWPQVDVPPGRYHVIVSVINPPTTSGSILTTSSPFIVSAGNDTTCVKIQQALPSGAQEKASHGSKGYIAAAVLIPLASLILAFIFIRRCMVRRSKGANTWSEKQRFAPLESVGTCKVDVDHGGPGMGDGHANIGEGSRPTSQQGRIIAWKRAVSMDVRDDESQPDRMTVESKYGAEQLSRSTSLPYRKQIYAEATPMTPLKRSRTVGHGWTPAKEASQEITLQRSHSNSVKRKPVPMVTASVVMDVRPSFLQRLSSKISRHDIASAFQEMPKTLADRQDGKSSGTLTVEEGWQLAYMDQGKSCCSPSDSAAAFPDQDADPNCSKHPCNQTGTSKRDGSHKSQVETGLCLTTSDTNTHGSNEQKMRSSTAESDWGDTDFVHYSKADDIQPARQASPLSECCDEQSQESDRIEVAVATKFEAKPFRFHERFPSHGSGKQVGSESGNTGKSYSLTIKHADDGEEEEEEKKDMFRFPKSVSMSSNLESMETVLICSPSNQSLPSPRASSASKQTVHFDEVPEQPPRTDSRRSDDGSQEIADESPFRDPPSADMVHVIGWEHSNLTHERILAEKAPPDERLEKNGSLRISLKEE